MVIGDYIWNRYPERKTFPFQAYCLAYLESLPEFSFLHTLSAFSLTGILLTRLLVWNSVGLFILVIRSATPSGMSGKIFFGCCQYLSCDSKSRVHRIIIRLRVGQDGPICNW
jgi:hypothetical protein